MDILFLALPSIVSALTVAVLGVILKKLMKVMSAVEANNKATRYLLKERILHMCRKYQSLGYIPSFEAEVIQELFREYKSLGGNSFVESQVKKTLNLDIVKDE